MMYAPALAWCLYPPDLYPVLACLVLAPSFNSVLMYAVNLREWYQAVIVEAVCIYDLETLGRKCNFQKSLSSSQSHQIRQRKEARW